MVPANSKEFISAKPCDFMIKGQFLELSLLETRWSCLRFWVHFQYQQSWKGSQLTETQRHYMCWVFLVDFVLTVQLFILGELCLWMTAGPDKPGVWTWKPHAFIHYFVRGLILAMSTLIWSGCHTCGLHVVRVYVLRYLRTCYVRVFMLVDINIPDLLCL